MSAGRSGRARPTIRTRLLCGIALALLAGSARADTPLDAPLQLVDFARETLAGDLFGLRAPLAEHGITIGGDEIFEVQGNSSGGNRQGGVAHGRLELFADVDLGRAVGWTGAVLHANAYQIHGVGLSSRDLGNLLTVSNIEATPATRLFDLWVEQSFLDNRVSLRAGQIAADDEFFVSTTAALFVNSAFGWPSLLGINLPSGGPAYPLATPGMRVRVAVSPSLIVSAGLFNADPAPAGAGDPQQRDGDGTALRTDGGALLIGEAAYSFDLDDNLPGTLKIGAWYHSGDFASPRFDTAGRSLASPLSNGVPAPLQGDYGGHLILDQLVWRSSGSSDAGLGVFVRLGAAPSDRNLIQFHADGGLTLSGVVPGRAQDVLGLAFSYERVGDARRGLARDLRAVAGGNVPQADYEAVIELTYQAPVAPWLVVQPDVQLILHPDARLAAPGAPAARATHDALLFGLRTAVSL